MRRACQALKGSFRPVGWGRTEGRQEGGEVRWAWYWSGRGVECALVWVCGVVGV